MFFFDSCGDLHVTCDAGQPAAAAFGPRGISRPASPEEVGLVVVAGETPYTAASRVGRVIDPEDDEVGWSILG
jgi:hypothetical protein